MNNFKDLFNYLKTINNIDNFLLTNWKGKDKQESLFRLFAYLKCIPFFQSYNVCDGNLNKHTIKPLQSIQKILRCLLILKLRKKQQ